MAVPNYDDDVIEDYEEVSPDDSQAGARKVVSGQGGPVQKPTSGVKPSERLRPPTSANPRPATQMNPALKNKGQPGPDGGEPAEPGTPEELAASHAGKGQISRSQAKLIWIICIAICIVGGAAVGTHYFFFRDTGGGVAAGNTPRTNRPGLLPGNTKPEKSDHEKSGEVFVRKVGGWMNLMDRGKPWDFFLVRQSRFQVAQSKALDAKKAGLSTEEQEKLWVEAIKAWYEVRYAVNIVRLVYRDDSLIDFLGVDDINDFKQVLALTGAQMRDEKLQRYQAALTKVQKFTRDIQQFQTNILKYELVPSRIFVDDKFKPLWKAERDKYENSNPDLEEPVIEPDDLAFVKGPDYAEGEKSLYDKMIAEGK